jgi:outer membrane protein assembly factor BamB
MISRRTFMRECAALAALPMIARSTLQKLSTGASDTTMDLRPLKVIDYAYLLDVSPDGTKICVYSTKNPYDSFRWSGTWKQLNSPVPDKADALRVFEIGSWKEIASTILRQRALHATFFADGEAVHVDTGAPAPFIQRVLIDLKTGTPREMALSPWDFERFNMYYYALIDRVLLGAQHNSKTNRTDFLVRAELPAYKELKRVAFAEKRVPPPTGMTETPIPISGNRKVVVYTVDNRVLYRSTEDLEIIWEQEIDSKLLLFRNAVAFDGGTAAVCVGLGQPSWEKTPHIRVFDGKDGSVLARFPITNEVQSLALSPDHRFLAIGQNLPPYANGDTQANVIVYDIGSGKELTRVVHDQFRAHRNPDHSIRADGLRFTSDGKYLVSSGLHTKVWEIS